METLLSSPAMNAPHGSFQAADTSSFHRRSLQELAARQGWNSYAVAAQASDPQASASVSARAHARKDLMATTLPHGTPSATLADRFRAATLAGLRPNRSEAVSFLFFLALIATTFLV